MRTNHVARKKVKNNLGYVSMFNGFQSKSQATEVNKSRISCNALKHEIEKLFIHAAQR